MTNQFDDSGGRSAHDVPNAQWRFKEVRNAINPKKTSEIVIFVLDDDRPVRDAIGDLLMINGYDVKLFADCSTFLASYRPDQSGCLLVDGTLPEMGALDLIERLHALDHDLPAIVLTENASVLGAVRAMRAGATDYIEKPVSSRDLLASIKRALQHNPGVAETSAYRKAASRRVASLTNRQRQILDLVLDGHPSKNIAADLGLSQRTVDNHRAAIMRKCDTKTLPALVHTAICARCRYDGVDQESSLNS